MGTREPRGRETGSIEPETGDHVLELYVRSLAPPGATNCVQAAVEEAFDLARRGVVDAAGVQVWGAGVCPASPAAHTPAGRAILDRVADIREWARREGVDLGPFFEPRSVRSTITGDDYETIRFPVVTLVERVGDRIVDVVPRSRDGDHRCVEDALDRLGADVGTAPGDSTSPAD